MNLTPVKLEEATAQQRLDYATKFLNLDISGTESDEQILASIRTAQPGNAMIFVEVEDPADPPPFPSDIQPPQPDGERVAGSLGKGDPRAVIMIPVVETQDNSGKHDVAVGVNGVIWQLQRGKDLDVPWRVVEALKLSKQDIVRHNDEGDVIVTSADRVSFQFIRQPTPEEIADWHARTDSKFCP